MVLMLRFTGLRIGDVATLPKAAFGPVKRRPHDEERQDVC